MGLLSDPSTRKRIVDVISRHNNKLAVLCYVTGVVYFLALAHIPLNAGVYMSENALIPGLVEADFYDDNGAGNYYREYKEYHMNLKEKIEAVPQNKRDERPLYDLPTDWLVSRMRALGLDTYVHNYSYSYPVSILRDQVLHGQNVYGILRAPRAARTEAIVLSVPYRPPGSEGEKTAAGMALLLGVAKGFRRRTYWAKDVIFLVTDNEEVGMQAWLSAYHHSPMEYISWGELPGRSGPIQAAVNLEVGLEIITRINIKLEGLNGQLPNLDLVNTAVKLCRKERIPVTLQKRLDTKEPFLFEGWRHAVETMLHMMWNQASGSPTGNHGLFHRYHIEAITLQGVKIKNSRTTFGFDSMARVVEGIFRSLNNLLERFHQSFFFYLLPSTDRYVSIGLYFPPFGLLAAPILIKAVALWISYSFGSAKEENEDKENRTEAKETAGVTEGTKAKETSEATETAEAEATTEATEVAEDKDGGGGENDGSERSKDAESEKKEKEKENEKEAEQKEDEEEKDDSAKENAADQEQEKTEQTAGFTPLIPHAVMAAVFGLGSYHAPDFFVRTASVLHMRPGEGLLMGLLALQLSAMTFPRMLKRKAQERRSVGGVDWRLLKCVGLLALGVVAFATALMNISLAFFITVASVPVLVPLRPTHSRLGNLLQCAAVVAISPLATLVIVAAVNHLMTSSASPLDSIMNDPMAVFTSAWGGAQHSLLYTVVNAHMYGNWTFSLLTLAYWPIWLLFWSLLWTDPL